MSKELVARLGVPCVSNTPVKVTLADDSQVLVETTAEMLIRVCDDKGKIISDATQQVSCYVLNVMPAPVVLGMPWLRAVNPSVDWTTLTMKVGDSTVTCVPTKSTATVEICSA